MPRGVKRDLEEQIALIDASIDKKLEQISALKSHRRNLAERQKSEKAAQIVKLAEEKGLSIDDLLTTLQKVSGVS